LIIGLLDERGYLIQIGVLLYTEAETVRVYSRVAKGVRRIELGYVKLTTTGKELGFLEL
jgi:polynucleotide 5'-kinase involved in rRNA processing